MEPQTKEMAALQKLRMQISRLIRKGEGAAELLQELQEREESDKRGKKRSLGSTTLPVTALGSTTRPFTEHTPRPMAATLPKSTDNPRPRAASARRAMRSRSRDEDIPPKPDRPPPIILNYPHEIRPELDVDWTLCPDDSAKELRVRAQRNEITKEQLQLGKPVIYRSSGWSLYPRVWSNELCNYDPVTSADEVHEGDICVTKSSLANGLALPPLRAILLGRIAIVGLAVAVSPEGLGRAVRRAELY